MSKKTHKIIVMFSGGLDSVMATHLLMEQGLDVVALHFVLPFYAGVGAEHTQIKNYANALGVKLEIREEGEEFLEMMREPQFGYGKNANPCIDCRIHRLKKAAKIMEEMGAVCLATGEVAGQRPMSQKLPMLNRVEKLAELKGKLLRPLCAKLLTPTDAETSGIVDREKLYAISGRSRAVQLQYAKEHNLIHGAPAGGCILTNIDTGIRFLDLQKHDRDFSLAEFKLIAYGRHFRVAKNFRFIVSRDEDENNKIEKIFESMTDKNSCALMMLRDTTGPVCVAVGELNNDNLKLAASAVVRFSKMRNADKSTAVVANVGGKELVVEAKCADNIELDRYRLSK